MCKKQWPVAKKSGHSTFNFFMQTSQNNILEKLAKSGERISMRYSEKDR